MMQRKKKMIALFVTIAFLTLLPVHSMPATAGQALDQEQGAAASAEQNRNSVEKEMQVGYQAQPKRILPIILGIAAAAAVVFLLVILVSKEKYDITGQWDFRNDYTTEGFDDFDSVWTFIANDDLYKQFGIYVREEKNGSSTQGQYTVVNKMEVVFQGDFLSEQYVGKFDSKTTMSGTFVLADGAEGTWTATKR